MPLVKRYAYDDEDGNPIYDWVYEEDSYNPAQDSQLANEQLGFNIFNEGSLNADGTFNPAKDSQLANTMIDATSGPGTALSGYTTPDSAAVSGITAGSAGSKLIDSLKAAYDKNPFATSVTGLLALKSLYDYANKGNSAGAAGYTKVVPTSQMVRQQVPYKNVGRRPGSSGRQYFTDTQFVAPAGVQAALANSEAQKQALLERESQNMAKGGNVPRYLQGTTDGMADKIPTSIDGKDPAALSHGEFVIPADVVSHLGNGNSDAGAKKLYDMMARVRKARTGNPHQGKRINPDKFMPGGLATLNYAAGGDVKGFDGTTGSTVSGTPLDTSKTSTLSPWVGDYVTNALSRGEALATAPYEAYTGPLTAGVSGLQQKAFDQASNLQTPASIGAAAATAGDISNKMQNLQYNPTTFNNTFAAPDAYKTGTFTNAFTAPTIGEGTTQFTNQYTAPNPYQSTDFTTGTFDANAAQQYMNPYLQSSLAPQLEEARRQSQITQMGNAAKMTGAGAFGGSRQALMDTETQRNLGANLANITGQGYNTAYTNAMSQFNADQARKMQAQQATEASKQFGASQAATAAQLQAQYGLNAQQAQEAARQFNSGQRMTAAQLQAQYGLNAQQAEEASRQFGAQQGMTSAQLAAQYGNEAQKATEASKQFGANYGLQGLQGALSAAQTQGNLGAQEAQVGLANLKEMADLGSAQRNIENEGIAADKAAFEEQRDWAYKMPQYQLGLLNGLPISTTTSSTETNPLSTVSGLTALYEALAKLNQNQP